jgi:L-malate glycosyltransferase
VIRILRGALETMRVRALVFARTQRTRRPPRQKPAPKQKPGYLFVLPWGLEHPGGVNQAVANLFDEVARDGRYAPLLLVNDWNSRLPRAERVGGRDHIYYRLRGPWDPRRPFFGFLRFAIALPHVLASLLWTLIRHRVAIINVHYPSLAAYPFALMKRIGLFKGRVVLSLHGTDLHSAAKATGSERDLFHALYRTADAIVGCSQALSAEAKAFTPEAAERIHTIHNGLDLQTWLEDRNNTFALPHSLGTNDFILNIAKYEWKKGQDVLLRAFSRVAQKHAHLRLVIIGATGPALSRISALVKELDLESRVVLFENMPHKNLYAFMERAVLLALPSRWEGLPIVLLEAGAMRLPVIATNVGGVPELVTHGTSGILVPTEDDERLANAMLDLLADPYRRRFFGANLYNDVVGKFTWKRACSEYLRICE